MKKAENVYAYGYTDYATASRYFAKHLPKDITSIEQADTVVAFKKIDFEELGRLISQNVRIVWEAYPRFTQEQADLLAAGNPDVSKCAYIEKAYYTHYYASLKKGVQSGEYGKLQSVQIRGTRLVDNDMDLRRLILADICVLLSLVNDEISEIKSVKSRRGIAKGRASIRFVGGVTASYDYTTDTDKDRSVWILTFENAILVCSPLKGRVRIIRNGEEEIHRYSTAVSKRGISEDMRRFLDGEPNAFIPALDFLTVRDLLIRLR